MNKYMLNIDNIYGVCECGCVMIKGKNDVYKPSQVENYKEIVNTYGKEFWCCNGCQNGYYKDGKEHSWMDKHKNIELDNKSIIVPIYSKNNLRGKIIY